MFEPKLCVVGLGYVGLPLAIELARYFPVTGFDINEKRISTLQSGKDPNDEVADEVLLNTTLKFSNDPSAINGANFVIVAVPTPVDAHNNPDFTPLWKSSETVGKHMARGTIVVYESTVYPGATEDECIPVLEKSSGMTWKKDFFVGYSPERINPGDKVHTFATITKIVSGDTPETLDKVALVYGTAVKAGIHRAGSIAIAEAAKVIENTQRDINIALMNELRIIFDRMGISTKAVLEAAGTKWNFLHFEPGLVGGHCIGVDPYYLAYKAEAIGHHPQIIMAGRRINDGMARYFARTMIKDMIKKGTNIKGAKVLVLGITFKENVPDIRNSKVVDIISELSSFGIEIDICDPVAEADEVAHEYKLNLTAYPAKKSYHGVLLAVKHKEFLDWGQDGIKAFCTDFGIVYDIKEAFTA